MKPQYGKSNPRNNRSRIDMKFKNQGRPKTSLYAIYPDYWKVSWGEPPLLGHVYAEDAFNAVRRASVIKGIYHHNFTFKPLAIKVKSKSITLNREQLSKHRGFCLRK